MKYYISALGNASKLKFSSCVYLLSVNQILQYRHAQLILFNVEEVYIFEHGICISALEMNRKL